MKKSLLYVVAIDVVFIAFLMLSGIFRGIVSDIVYFAAFILPFVIFLLTSKKYGMERHRLTVLTDSAGFGITFSVAAPTVLLVFGLSMLTGWLVSMFATPPVIELEDNVFYAIILHALVPAVLEEALFRYIPLTLITPHSRKCAVILSSVLFAFAHCNLAQLPYALVAGIIFAWCDLAAGSIAPSVILHFVNNAVAIVWQKYIYGTDGVPIFVSVLVILALFSAIPIFLMRGRLKASMAFLRDKSDRMVLTREIAVYMVITLALSLITVFVR